MHSPLGPLCTEEGHERVLCREDREQALYPKGGRLNPVGHRVGGEITIGHVRTDSASSF